VVDAGPGGLALTTVFEHDARGNTTRVIDPRGNDVLTVYNALNQPVTVPKQTQGATFGERVRTTFFYDANNNLVRIDRENRGPDGAFDETQPYWSSTYEYDSLNRPTQIAHEAAHTLQQSIVTNQFVYDANGRFTDRLLKPRVGGRHSRHATQPLPSANSPAPWRMVFSIRSMPPRARRQDRRAPLATPLLQGFDRASRRRALSNSSRALDSLKPVKNETTRIAIRPRQGSARRRRHVSTILRIRQHTLLECHSCIARRAAAIAKAVRVDIGRQRPANLNIDRGRRLVSMRRQQPSPRVATEEESRLCVMRP
jgi:YD repeat-containing protein